MLKLKRISSYLIDILLMFLLIGVISISAGILKETNTSSFINNIIGDYQGGNYTFLETYNKLAVIFQTADQENVLNLIVSAVTAGFMWILVPVVLGSQTFGMKIMHLQMLSNIKKITVKQLIIRSFLLSGLGILIISLLFLYILNASLYTLLLLILLITQIILIIYDLFMILYSSDGCSLIDKWTNIKIIEVKK